MQCVIIFMNNKICLINVMLFSLLSSDCPSDVHDKHSSYISLYNGMYGQV